MEQDFSRRAVIVVRTDLLGWQSANVVAHIAAYLGNALKDSFATGSVFTSADGTDYPRNAQYPIIIKSAATSGELTSLLAEVRAQGMLHLGFIREMIETTDDAEIVRILATKPDADIELLGVGLFGTNEEASALTKKFGLAK